MWWEEEYSGIYQPRVGKVSYCNVLEMLNMYQTSSKVMIVGISVLNYIPDIFCTSLSENEAEPQPNIYFKISLDNLIILKNYS